MTSSTCNFPPKSKFLIFGCKSYLQPFSLFLSKNALLIADIKNNTDTSIGKGQKLFGVTVREKRVNFFFQPQKVKKKIRKIWRILPMSHIFCVFLHNIKLVNTSRGGWGVNSVACHAAASS